MAAVCCAAGALVLLSIDPNSTMAAKDVMKRCGKTCRGAGDTADQGPAGCEGMLFEPRASGGTCPLNSTMLLNFQGNPRFGGTDKHGVCRGPECPAIFEKVVKVHPQKNRAVRIRAMPVPRLPVAEQQVGTVIQFKGDRVPPKSSIKGPLTIQCTGSKGRLSIGAGTTLTDILVKDCNETCPFHVRLNRKDGKTHTEITNVQFRHHTARSDVLAEASMCALLITPVASKNHPRDFVGRGKVTLKTAYGHNVAIANVDGEIVVANTNSAHSVVTLLDTVEDSNGRLTLQRSGNVQLRNLTAIMHVFSQEYMVEYFGPSDQRRRDMGHLVSFNWLMVVLLINLVAGQPKLAHKALSK